MRFRKMHGLGNDYVYVDVIRDPGVHTRLGDLSALTRVVSDRFTGIGSDGLILLCPPSPGVEADLRMRMFNADGSESEMCGNGIRCVCKFAHDQGLTRANPMRIETGAGVLSLAYTLDAATGLVDLVTVDMGEPILELSRIPVDAARVGMTDHPHRQPIEIDGATWFGTFVSMGNPHVTFFQDDEPRRLPSDLHGFDFARFGPLVEHHPAFPRRINAHLARVVSPVEGVMRTWERGAGLTRACGTGACAVAVAGMLTGRFEREVLLHLPGGDLTIRWDAATNHVFKTGPATDVFAGEWPEA